MALVAAVALALSACSGGTEEGGEESATEGGATGEQAGGGTLTLGVITFPTSFAANEGRWANWAPYYQAVYDTLLRQEADGTVVPWLAEEWSYDESQTVLTMTLRDDVVFSDGEPFNAEAAAANLIRFRDGTAPDASQLSSMTDAVAVDETTLEITLSAANPAFVVTLSKAPGYMGSPAAFDAEDAATNPVGSGPYILDTGATVTESTYRYTANPDYWNPDVQYFDELVINYYADATASVNAALGGEADAVKLINNDNLAEIEGAGWGIVQNELDVTGILLYDRAGELTPALGDVRVRQAINHAFDREAMLNALAAGNGTVTGQVFPLVSPAFDESLDEAYPYDPEKAKELLAEAGYADGFELAMPSTSLLGNVPFDLMQQYLGEIGITLAFTDVGTNYIDDMLAAKYSAAYMILQEDVPDHALAQFMLAPNSAWNPFKYDDPEATALMETVQTGTEDERAAAAAELNQLVVDEAWFAPLFRVKGSYAFDPETVTVTHSQTNAYPMLYDIVPAS